MEGRSDDEDTVGCVLVVAGVLSGSVEGAVMGVATLHAIPPGVPFTSPDSALGAPWVSYSLDLQSTAGELIGAIDAEIKGPLHQRLGIQ